jgi:2-polyprenyl-3-methyl-5-hydroxy-6-metoxy-1,4-benzoquinol methylase
VTGPFGKRYGGRMIHENLWLRKIAEHPGHSQWYIERFRDLEARGADLAGEARLIDAMVPRGSRILDAGCGTGRVGGHLAAAGHTVVGVDLDPALIAEASERHPGPTWLVGDLSDLKLDEPPFDVVVCAGNVLTFVAPSTRTDVLRTLSAQLAPEGRAVIGFGAGRDYAFSDFLTDAEAAGLTADLLLGTWDLRPFTPASDFLVAVLRR